MSDQPTPLIICLPPSIEPYTLAFFCGICISFLCFSLSNRHVLSLSTNILRQRSPTLLTNCLSFFPSCYLSVSSSLIPCLSSFLSSCLLLWCVHYYLCVFVRQRSSVAILWVSFCLHTCPYSCVYSRRGSWYQISLSRQMHQLKYVCQCSCWLNTIILKKKPFRRSGGTINTSKARPIDEF